MALRHKIDNPHFSYFLRGHPGLRLRDDIERDLRVKIQVPSNVDEVIVEGSERSREEAWEELRLGWFDDDFAKAKEILDLTDASPDAAFFNVNPKHVSSLIGHYGRRVAGFEARSKASIKIDCSGHISMFGTTESCERAREGIEDWIRRENGDPNAGLSGDPAEDHLSPPTSCSSRSLHETSQATAPALPCQITFWLPRKAVPLLLGADGERLPELEAEHRCFISVRTADETPDAMIPVDITNHDSRAALDAKEAILALIAQSMPRDWPDKVKIRTIGQPQDVKLQPSSPELSSPESRSPCAAGVSSSHSINGGPPPIKGEFRQLSSAHSCPQLPPLGFPPGFPPMPPPWAPEMGAPPVARLTFSVADEHAPRLIGTRGVNKRRLEERTNSCLILRTEERAGGSFPVDVLARTREDCERARGLVCAFLNERPSTHTPPPTFSAVPPLPTALIHSIMPIALSSAAAQPPSQEANIYGFLQSESEESAGVGNVIQRGFGGFSLLPDLGPPPGLTMSLSPRADFFSDIEDADECIESGKEVGKGGFGWAFKAPPEAPKVSSNPYELIGGEGASGAVGEAKGGRPGFGFAVPKPASKAPKRVQKKPDDGAKADGSPDFFNRSPDDFFTDLSSLRADP